MSGSSRARPDAHLSGPPPRRPPERRLAFLLGLPLLLLLAVPLVGLALYAGPSALVAGLAHPATIAALGLSLATSLASLVLVVALGTPLAWWLARARSSTARRSRALAAIVETLIDLPVVLPPAVLGLAMLLVLGREGVVGKPLGLSLAFTPVAVVLVQLVVSAPFYVQSATAAFRALDPELLGVARTLGASPARVFFRVAAPLAAGGLAAGALLAWARALGEFGATLLFAGNFPGRTQTLPIAIYTELEVDAHVAQAMAMVLLVTALMLLLLVRFLGGSARMLPPRSPPGSPERGRA